VKGRHLIMVIRGTGAPQGETRSPAGTAYAHGGGELEQLLLDGVAAELGDRAQPAGRSSRDLPCPGRNTQWSLVMVSVRDVGADRGSHQRLLNLGGGEA
jgi:hypothetical protein